LATPTAYVATGRRKEPWHACVSFPGRGQQASFQRGNPCADYLQRDSLVPPGPAAARDRPQTPTTFDIVAAVGTRGRDGSGGARFRTRNRRAAASTTKSSARRCVGPAPDPRSGASEGGRKKYGLAGARRFRPPVLQALIVPKFPDRRCDVRTSPPAPRRLRAASSHAFRHPGAARGLPGALAVRARRRRRIQPGINRDGLFSFPSRTCASPRPLRPSDPPLESEDEALHLHQRNGIHISTYRSRWTVSTSPTRP